MLNRSSVCLNNSFSGSEFERLAFAYFLPPVLCVGIIGNLLTLLVLLNKRMRSKANILLSAIAFFGTIGEIMIIPHTVIALSFVNERMCFRLFYYLSKKLFATLSNWSGIVVNWLIVALCAERLIGIRNPFHARKDFNLARTISLILFLAVLAGYVILPNYLQYNCVITYFCNDTHVRAICYDITQDPKYANTTSPIVRNYIRWSVFLSPFITHIIPNIVLIILNIALIMAMRGQVLLKISSQRMTGSDSYDSAGTMVSTCESELSKSSSSPKMVRYRSMSKGEESSLILRRNMPSAVPNNTENKLALTICAIITSFTLTQTPVAIVLAIDTLKIDDSPGWRYFQVITQCASVLGVSMNFILFCLISQHFRNQLKAIMLGYIRKRQ